MINRLEPGDRQISASGWNEMRAFINDYEVQQSHQNIAVKNPFLITIKNTSGYDLDPLAVVKLDTATYTDRTGDTFANKGIEFGTELNGTTVTSEDDNVAIVQAACPSNGFCKAIADGCTPCFVQVADANKEYKYAKPITNDREKLEATEDATQIKLLWYKKALGKQPAYVCLDAMGAGDKPKIASSMVDCDYRPEGATSLSTANTWLVADTIDAFKTESDENPPKIANPLGLPPGRPVVIAKCSGFEPGTQEEGSSVEPPEMEAVAIAADTRDLFIINAGHTTDTQTMTGNPGTIYKKGNIVPIRWNSTRKMWESAADNWSLTNKFVPQRLAVCQRDLPDGYTKEFLMPYYTPEMNYGYYPNKSTNRGESFTTRCGVQSGDFVFSNKRIDYSYNEGRYTYEPKFMHTGNATQGPNGNGVGLYIDGKLYSVEFRFSWGVTALPRLYPDIWESDTIVALVDARGATGVHVIAVEYPLDLKEGSMILANPYAVSNEGYNYRGWEDVTEEYYPDGANNTIVTVYSQGIIQINNANLASGQGITGPTVRSLIDDTGMRIYRKTKPTEDGCLY